MIRFCDREVYCVSDEELDRGTLLNYFFQGNMDEMVCVIGTDGTYHGRITYHSLINCDNAKDAVLEDCVILNEDFWECARDFFVSYQAGFREHILLPVLDEQRYLISFAYEDLEANRELRMLKELEELETAFSFADVYPQYECVKICGCNELAFRFAEYLRKRNICVETDGELWERFLAGGERIEAPDYKRLVIYAEGVCGGYPENWVENLLRSVSPEFECVDCIYEANWEEGFIRDAETNLAGLLDYLRKTDKEIAILGSGIEEQNAYDFLAANGIEASYFVSNVYTEKEHLLLGERILNSAGIWNRRDELILLDCREEHSALGMSKSEWHDYIGFRRNRDLFFLNDYLEIPYDNLKHTLRNQKILFVGDILLCERIAGYLRENVEVKGLYFADILDEKTWGGVCENAVLQQVKLEDIEKDTLCLIVSPILNGVDEVIAIGVKRRRELVCILRETGFFNYTDYFSYMRTFIALEREMPIRGIRKEQFRPGKVVVGASEGCCGNGFVKWLLDNHPSLLVIPDFSFFNSNLFWICVRLAGVSSECMLPLLKEIYQSESDTDIYNRDVFEEKMRYLLEPGKTYTSQELFVILILAYNIAVYGRDIDDISDMVIYWEPHITTDTAVAEAFVEWIGTKGSLCSIFNLVRNICMVKGARVKERFTFEPSKWGEELIYNVVCPNISRKNREGCVRYDVRFEDIKKKPREELVRLCKEWEIPWSETLMETTMYGQKRGYYNGEKKVEDFDLTPVYNNYEKYFSSFDRFRIALICAPWQKKYGYPYVKMSDFTRRELQEMFLREFRFEEAISYNGEKGRLDAKIRLQIEMQNQLWEMRKWRLLEKNLESKDGNNE